MTESKYLDDLRQFAVDNTIDRSHFGANFVAGINSFGNDSNFSEIVERLGVSAIRYPGGTVTEKYFGPRGSVWEDLFERDLAQTRASDGQVIEGPGKLFDYADDHDLGIQFVLPTSDLVNMKNGKAEIDGVALNKIQVLVGDLLSGRFGEANITHFEIGNEYYFHADLTAEEYGAVANAIIQAVDEAIQDYVTNGDVPSDWNSPKIAVQAGAGWQEGDNAEIIAALSQDSLDLVDSVIVHYYSPTLEQTESRERHLEQIEKWESAVGDRKLDFFASEWNIYGGPDADTGMAQASALISGFETLIDAGVSTASIWGAQFRWLEAGLSSNFGGSDLSDTEARLSVAGEIVASMQESLVGLSSIRTENSDIIGSVRIDGAAKEASGNRFEVNSFGNEDRAVIYISSRTTKQLQLTLDPANYFGETVHIWGELLTSIDDPATTWKDESNPNSPHGLPKFEILSESELTNGAIIVPPGGILRISVQLSNDGVEMDDHDPIFQSDVNYDDELIGSEFDDRMNAHVGSDDLFGRAGNDSMRSGDGADNVFGGRGRDALFGENGNDRIFGGHGDDVVAGGDGHDKLYGNAGDDILSGGQEDDRLFGGKGDDILSGGAGNDTMSGGDGGDYFVCSLGASGTITDFDASEGDRITFLGQFEDKDALVAAISTTEDDGGDLIINGPDGSKLILEGAGDQVYLLANSVVDFQEAGIGALELSDQLNEMSGSQLQNLLDEMGSEQFETTFLSVDPIILFANLDARVAGQLLETMEPSDIEVLFGHVGLEGLLIGLSEYTSDEVVTFFDYTSEENAQMIVSLTGEQQAKSLLDGMDHEDKDRLEPKLLGKVEDVQQTSLEDFPTVPIAEIEEEDASDQPAEAGVVSADCFVATVAYSDGNHPEVWLLRWYRDTIMRRSYIGRALIVLYWWLGPQLAEAVYGRPKSIKTARLTIGWIVDLICWYYGRSPGRQDDQPCLFDSRLIRLRKR
ncbi:CFI-box-CTERM domain-containing protein [Yoonia sp. R2331]|uniref:CFI-box-CTERM domain-containing protein n=1 Tax=Yoonia sp. R2331 TaxID=3237238 RepID=UPI0034E5B836